jgi:lipoprotein-anchoring transpeptidase ErfK/SrfK
MKLIRACAPLALLVTLVVTPASAATPSTPSSPAAALAATLFNPNNGMPYGYTELAAMTHSVFEYSAPGKRLNKVLSNKYDGSSLTMPVVQDTGSWLLVRLPQRPNGQETWIQRSQVVVAATPYLILIDTATTHLELYYKGKVILNAPAGVGTKLDPTPLGRFFVAFFAQPPNAGYGPFVIVTSGHSNKITDWEMSGDAMVAIHGPLGADRQIGTKGAHISHGCVRLHVVQQKKLQHVPVGTPVVIID